MGGQEKMKMSTVKAESPLNQIDLSELASSGVLQLNEQRFLSYVILRGNANDPVFMTACAKVLGGELPKAANTVAHLASNIVLWYGPDEWLLVSETESAEKLQQQLKADLEACHSSVVDISGANTMIKVAGTSARDFLAKGSPFDFHATQFNVGQCAQTVLAKTAVTIYPVKDGNEFHVIVRRSFADYLGVWMLDAAKEFMHD